RIPTPSTQTDASIKAYPTHLVTFVDRNGEGRIQMLEKGWGWSSYLNIHGPPIIGGRNQLGGTSGECGGVRPVMGRWQEGCWTIQRRGIVCLKEGDGRWAMAACESHLRCQRPRKNR
ncbi:hypothetical protein BHE74_00051819, partial [Ensete ventricosum]